MKENQESMTQEYPTTVLVILVSWILGKTYQQNSRQVLDMDSYLLTQS